MTWCLSVQSRPPMKKPLPAAIDQTRYGTATFLIFFQCLSAWEETSRDCGKLSNEVNPCSGLLAVAGCCLSEPGLNYVHLGKFRRCLEARFGQYRQLSGGKYNISSQVFETEKKLRLLSTLKLKLKEKEITLTNFEQDWNEFGGVPNDSNEQPVLPSNDDFVKVEEIYP